ncbi:MAG: hypothetical protein QG596_294 [Actinomycetota bacterium]|jgi:hypothetical protein|nr:hypothetical protein [Actinomycetota bacterium]
MAVLAGKRPLALGIGLAALLVLFAATAPQSKAGFFQEGVVEVNGYGWSTDPVNVQLADIAPTDDGATTYTVRDILQDADPRSGQFNLDTVPGVSVALPGSVNSVSCTGDQVRAESAACPLFTSTADYTEMRFRKNGQTRKVRYKAFNPEIYISQAQELKVTLSPASKRIESGDSVTFTATVTGATGSVSYDWDFGDGQTDNSGSKTVTHKFTGDDEQFVVVVDATAQGQRGDDAFATITVGKVEKKKPKNKKPENTDSTGGTGNSGGYIPGYSDGGYGGYGGGTSGGSGSPSTGNPTPQQPKDKEPQQPVDDGLDTVSGQLIDPSQITAIAPPADAPATDSQPTEEAGDSGGGGGISDGALTVIGIGALLGLGGLAEAGAFAGFRRFRFRL